MTWMEDRDRLIAETLAFVNEVAGEQPSFAAQLQAAVTAEIEPATCPMQVEKQPEPLRPLVLSDMREDIHARVAAFKIRQQAMQAEREAYFKKTIESARATVRNSSLRPGHPKA